MACTGGIPKTSSRVGRGGLAVSQETVGEVPQNVRRLDVALEALGPGLLSHSTIPTSFTSLSSRFICITGPSKILYSKRNEPASHNTLVRFGGTRGKLDEHTMGISSMKRSKIVVSGLWRDDCCWPVTQIHRRRKRACVVPFVLYLWWILDACFVLLACDINHGILDLF